MNVYYDLWSGNIIQKCIDGIQISDRNERFDKMVGFITSNNGHMHVGQHTVYQIAHIPYTVPYIIFLNPQTIL